LIRFWTKCATLTDNLATIEAAYLADGCDGTGRKYDSILGEIVYV
jgi:hypothetical protein